MTNAYRPDIDGLRAVAVLLVVAYHAFPSAVPAGFLGVDVFFVISGFLITRIIAGEMEAGRFTLGEFYARRVRRIFPALLLVLGAALAMGWLVLASVEYETLGRHVVGGAGFLSNFVLWSETGYFGPEAESTPLLHLWSLAVEEQFYLVWPLVLMLTRRSLWAVVAVGVASLAANQLVSDPTAAFYLPATRMWELAAGGALALWRSPARGSDLASAAGIALLCTPLLLISATKRPDVLAVLCVAGVVLLIHAGPGAALNRLLAHRWLVGVGLISYPLYLWHWPLLAFLTLADHNTSAAPRIVAVAGSVVLAVATYRWLERPVRQHGGRRTVTALVGCMIATAGAGAFAWFGGGQPRAAISGADAFVRAMREWPFPGDAALTKSGELEVRTLGPASAPATLFIGDSFAQQYFPRVDAVLPSGRRAVFVTKPSCSVIPGVTREGSASVCFDFGSQAVAYAMQAVGVDTIVVSSSIYSDMERSQGAEVVVAFERMVSRLASSGRRVFVVMPPPASKVFAQGPTIRRTLLGPEVVPKVVPRENISRPFHAELVAAARRHGARVIEPADSVCDTVCSTVWDGAPVYYSDGTHLSAAYTRKRAAFIDQVLH